MSVSISQLASLIKKKVDAESASVLLPLIYYDLFDHALTAEEIFRHGRKSYKSVKEVERILDTLIRDGLVFSHDALYALHDNNGIFKKRIRGNEAAQNVMAKAWRRSKLISRFPFVRGICISGSLSKNYFDAKNDVDFFIITEPNRLWICRTFLILFKKIFLLNSKKYFCINYLIDSANLKIPDENIFTATEVITLLPVYNYDLYHEFLSANRWVNHFFPESSERTNDNVLQPVALPVKKLLEFLLGGRTGEWLDQILFTLTLRHWKKKFGGLPDNEFEVNMRSRRNISKHHPQGFQFQVLKKYEERCREFEQQHQLSLS